MKSIKLLVGLSIIFTCGFVNAQIYRTASNGDAQIIPGNAQCYNGASLTVEKGGSSTNADVKLNTGYSCAGTSGKIYLNANTVASGNLQTSKNMYVKGKIYATEVEITRSVPSADYVFREDYNLLPLSDVASFISKNRHLPNVPSAAEFKQNGYSIGDMDNLLLEKIEELTLHIIKQEQRIKELERKVK